MEHELDKGSFEDLAKYRIRAAWEDIRAAELLFDAGAFKAANNRAYYAVFHAINAVHALEQKGYKRHKDAISNFYKEYVKTGIFDRSFGRQVAGIEEIRHASDYDDFYIATKEEAKTQIESAKTVIEAIEQYIENHHVQSKTIGGQSE